MEQYQYIIINDVKYIIIPDATKYKFYKEKNNKLETLTEEEYEKINSIYNPEYNDIWYSQTLEKITFENESLNQIPILNALERLENLIPEKYRERFYQKLKTLKIIPITETSNKDEADALSAYRPSTNTIVFNYKNIYDKLKKNNPNITSKEITAYSLQTLIHEIVHMASSEYTEKPKSSYVGFNKYPCEKLSDNNIALTEGMTEMLANYIYPLSFVDYKTIAYGHEVRLVQQLSLIAGNDCLIDVFFGNKNLSEIENRLLDIAKGTVIEPHSDKKRVSTMFMMIESNYNAINNKKAEEIEFPNIKHLNHKHNTLFLIQNTLFLYLTAKCEKLYKNKDINAINELLTAYEKVLITPEMEKLILNGVNIENEYLDQNVQDFELLKERYLGKNISR